MDPWFWLLALSSAAGVYVLLLFAYRRIPRLPPPDDVRQLREEHLNLVDAFNDLCEKHDETVGRAHAKVGRLRRKLRKLQEEEGVDIEEDETGDVGGYPVEAPPQAAPTREQVKAYARARLHGKVA